MHKKMPTHPEALPKWNRSIICLDLLEVVILEFNMTLPLENFMSQYRPPEPGNVILLLIMEDKNNLKQNVFVITR
jgi:hypothetical protein